MYLGKIVETNDAEMLYKRPVHPYTRALLSSIPVPDPENVIRHEPLTGEVPSPITPPSGCYFHTRCPYAKDICKTDAPELRPVSHDNRQEWLVSCHFTDEFASQTKSV